MTPSQAHKPVAMNHSPAAAKPDHGPTASRSAAVAVAGTMGDRATGPYPYDLVVFDLAGTTVIDTGDVVAHTLCAAVKQVTQEKVSPEDANRLMGIPKPEAIAGLLSAARAVTVRSDEAEVAAVHQLFREMMVRHYRESPSVCEVPGTSEMFRTLRDAGVRIGLDTGFSRDITNAILERTGWDKAGLIDVSVTSDEVPAGRPAPYMLYRAMELTGVTSVARVVKVGDTPSDLWEGTNGGCGRVIGVTEGSHTRAQLLKHPHTDLIRNVTELPRTLKRPPRPALKLHTPGPANTAPSVRSAMTRDIGAWDNELIDLAGRLRKGLLGVAGVDPKTWDAVLIQGSGTYGVEAMVGAAVPRMTDRGGRGKLLVTVNGAYGERIARIGEALEIPTTTLRFDEAEPVDPGAVAHAVARDPEITTVAVVHCETTTGLLNDVATIGRAVRAVRPDIEYAIDAMSSFGAYDIDWQAAEADWVVTSSNKCLQGVPGIACVVARRSRLEGSAGRARGLSLDLYDQWRGLESHGRFRFTPPTHVLLAMQQALSDLAEEGGVRARYARYEGMRRRLVAGMTQRGYATFIRPEHRSCIISTFLYPDHPNFTYAAMYGGLQERGFVIYPGKLTKAESFRIGHIGDLCEEDIDDLLTALDEVAASLGFDPAGRQQSRAAISQATAAVATT